MKMSANHHTQRTPRLRGVCILRRWRGAAGVDRSVQALSVLALVAGVALFPVTLGCRSSGAAHDGTSVSTNSFYQIGYAEGQRQVKESPEMRNRVFSFALPQDATDWSPEAEQQWLRGCLDAVFSQRIESELNEGDWYQWPDGTMRDPMPEMRPGYYDLIDTRVGSLDVK